MKALWQVQPPSIDEQKLYIELIEKLKSIRVHFASGSNGRSFPHKLFIEIPSKLCICGTRNALFPRDFEFHGRFIYCPPRVYDVYDARVIPSKLLLQASNHQVDFFSSRSSV